MSIAALSHKETIATTISKKYQRAITEEAKVSEYFAVLTESCPAELIEEWTHKIEMAEANRQEDVTTMDYMKSMVQKR